MPSIKELIRRYERRRLTEDTPAKREELGQVFDVLDDAGGFYMDSFLARFSVGFAEICALLFVLVCAATVVKISLSLHRWPRPFVGVAVCAAFTLYSLYLSARYVRQRNASTVRIRGEYVEGMREAGAELDEAALDRRFTKFAEWPVWAAHAALLAFVGYGLARSLQLF